MEWLADAIPGGPLFWFGVYVACGLVIIGILLWHLRGGNATEVDRYCARVDAELDEQAARDRRARAQEREARSDLYGMRFGSVSGAAPRDRFDRW